MIEEIVVINNDVYGAEEVIRTVHVVHLMTSVPVSRRPSHRLNQLLAASLT